MSSTSITRPSGVEATVGGGKGVAREGNSESHKNPKRGVTVFRDPIPTPK